ncbi:MAG: hypothetical protein KDK97_12595 [Verrucomicrobiales bacterium]|nr:hypothetical protein [Verrucomicrobiales bacterium]
MNGKQLACVILLMLIGGITYAAQIVHKKAELAVTEAAAAEDAATAANDERGRAEIRKNLRKTETDEVRRFLKTWTPIIARFQVPQEVENAVQMTLRDKAIFVVSQKFETKPKRTGDIIGSNVMANLVIEDEYAKTMNWLGSLEQRLPTGRVVSCRLTGGGSGRQVHLELSMDVPIIDLRVDPTAKAGKK